MDKFTHTFVSSVLLLVCLLVGSIASSEKMDLRSQPLHITSDRVVVDERKATITFEGHVYVRQADISISCDRLTIYGNKSSKPDPNKSVLQQIDRIEVEGNVRVVQGNRIASSKKAIYDLNKQKIFLTGNPVVAQGKDRLTGQLITIDLKTRKSIVEGGSERPVEVVIHPGEGKTGVVK